MQIYFPYSLETVIERRIKKNKALKIQTVTELRYIHVQLQLG